MNYSSDRETKSTSFEDIQLGEPFHYDWATYIKGYAYHNSNFVEGGFSLHHNHFEIFSPLTVVTPMKQMQAAKFTY